MAICTYFLRGACKFGNNCRNEHPQDGQKFGTGFGNSAWTNPRNQGASSKAGYLFSTDSMRQDLTPQADKPLWPLSSYGAAKHEPTLLAGLDESPEELRFRAFTAHRAGKPAEYVAYEAGKIAAAQQVFANALTNLGGAYAQATRMSSSNSGTKSAFESTPPFGTTSAFGTPAFGQTPFTGTSAPVASTSAFTQQSQLPSQPSSVFGQPQQPSQAFGQPQPPTSAFGQPQPTLVFGQPPQSSSLIKPASGAFGNLTSTGSSNAFGGTSFSPFASQSPGFGAGAQTTSGFGQTSFGTTSAGQPSSTFGASSAPAFGTTSAFGTLGSKSPTSVFGAPAFGQGSGAPGSNLPSSQIQSQASSGFGVVPAPSAFAPLTSSEPQKLQSAFSSQPPSAFPMASPSPSMSTPAPSASNAPGPPDFTNAPSQYKPGLSPYDLNLPSDYQQRLPAEVLEAFKAQKFEWGKLPDWIPPLELR